VSDWKIFGSRSGRTDCLLVPKFIISVDFLSVISVLVGDLGSSA